MTQPGVPRFLANTPADQSFSPHPGLGQQVASFRYEVVNGVTGVRIGEVTPLRSTIPVLVHNTQNTIMRTLTGFNLGAADTAALNPITDRIKVFMVVANPDGTTSEYPLGRYMYSANNYQVLSGGDLAQNSLYDEMFIVDQLMTTPFSTMVLDATFGSFSTINSFFGALKILLAPLVDAGLLDYRVSGKNSTIGGSWPSGTSRAKVLSDLCSQANRFQPWFDNNGVMQIIDSFNPASKEADFDFDDVPVVHRDSISYTNDFINAPNTFIAVNNSGITNGVGLEASGTYTVPPTAPWSVQNRGFVIPYYIETQVATPSASMASIAQTYAEQYDVFERAQMSTATDPRHDSYDVVRWQNANWLEIAYSIQLQAGAPTIRTLRKAYQ